MQIIPDISFWQDDPTTPQGVDFHMMSQKTPLVILRAGQGSYLDKKIKDHWKRAKEAGLKRGAYWFFDSRVSPKRQAELFAAFLLQDPPEERAWFDAEEAYGGQFTGWGQWYDFIERFRTLAPNIPVGIYTGYYYWTEYTTIYPAEKPTPKQLEYFGQFPLWIAWYNPTEPKIPKPWKDWLIWQYTDDAPGAEYGVESREIDLNYYKGEIVGETPTPKESTTLLAKMGDKLVEYREAE